MGCHADRTLCRIKLWRVTMTNSIKYAWAVALIEKIVDDHCEKLRREAELIEGLQARKNATEQIHTIKQAFNKIRNG